MRAITIFLLLIFLSLLANAQRLQRAKEDLSEESSSSSTSSSTTSFSTSDNSSSSSDHGSDLAGGFVVQVLYFASIGLLIGDLEHRSFYSYPYSNGNHGEYLRPELEVPPIKKSMLTISNIFAVQAGTYANDLKVSYRFIPPLSITVNHLRFFDRHNENEQLGTTSFLLDFYRIREKHITGYWGIGATYADSGIDTWGFAYNLGLDIYVGDPISIGLLWKQSFINQSSVNEFRGMLKYSIGRLAVQGGFVHYKLGDENFPSLGLGLEIRL